MTYTFVQKSLVIVVCMLCLGAMAVAQFQAQGWNNLQVTRATYGNGDRVRDVTALLNSQIQNNRLMIQVNNRTMGGDPAEGRPKTLTVWYTHYGRAMQTTVLEKSALNIGGQPTGLRILRADYGEGRRFMDVTARLNSQVQGDRLNLRITNETMGGDPAEDQRKVLTVWYSSDGHVSRVNVSEKEMLEIPSDQHAYQGNLQIMRAQYGADYRYRDVTEVLNSQVQGDRLNLQVTNATMGGDPAEDRPKTLTISYLYQGQNGRLVVREKEYLTLPASEANPWASNGTDLEILRAIWGGAGGSNDVTAMVASRLQGGRLQLPVTRYTMGSDPAPGQLKYLKIIYQWQGLRYESNVPENGTLILP